ncbi:MAG TPA: hypothetical protein VIX73_29620 [Kofleriaceae bacterium]|jgi:hypothetical protein
MRRAALAILVLASACTVGGSTSMVGRWRARRIIDSTACVQRRAPAAAPEGAQAPSADRCEKLISIGRDVPERSFSSGALTFPATGYMQQRGPDGYVGHGVALNSYFEYLRGRGGLAIGGRVGAQVSNGFNDRLYLLMPISVVAHAGGLWGSVYAGAGYSPVALAQQYVGQGDMKTTLPAVYYHNSLHAFVGTRFWLMRFLERGLSFSPEFRVETFGDSTLTSLTGNIGLHF